MLPHPLRKTGRHLDREHRRRLGNQHSSGPARDLRIAAGLTLRAAEPASQHPGRLSHRHSRRQQPGGSVEYNNEEPGAEWLQRLTHAFPKFAWINPEPQGVWGYRQSIAIIQQVMNQRMFPLTLQGLEGAMRLLSK